jgi:hypothetical protein
MLANATVKAEEKKVETDAAAATKKAERDRETKQFVKMTRNPGDIRDDLEAAQEQRAHEKTVAAMKERLKKMKKNKIPPDNEARMALEKRIGNANSPKTLAAHDEGVIEIRKQEIAAGGRGRGPSVARENSIAKELGKHNTAMTKIFGIPNNIIKTQLRILNRQDGSLSTTVLGNRDKAADGRTMVEHIDNLRQYVISKAATYSKNNLSTTIAATLAVIEDVMEKQRKADALINMYEKAPATDEAREKLEQLSFDFINFMSWTQYKKLEAADLKLILRIRSGKAAPGEAAPGEAAADAARYLPGDPAVAPPAPVNPNAPTEGPGGMKGLEESQLWATTKKIKDKILSIINRIRQPNNQQGN